MYRILPILLLLLALAACGGLAPTPEATATYVIMPEPTSPGTANIPRDEASVPRAALEQAYTAWTAGAAIIVDVRSQASYDTGHIAGAINIPLGEFEANIASLDLPKDAWIITYCTWQNEHTSARAAFLLLQNGYSNVTPLLGGYDAWVNAGYPIKP